MALHLGRLSFAVALGAFTAACGQLIMSGPKDISLAPIPDMVTYRDLATIPARPEPLPVEEKARSINRLTEDREAAASAAQGLRAQPFSPPAPPSLSGPENP
jgi:hypothetical protein